MRARDVTVQVAGRSILDRVSLDLPEAAVTAVLGPNGAGKSTLLRVLAGVLTPQQGTVSQGGQSLAVLGPQQLAVRRTYLAQEQQVAFDFSVRDVVLWGRAPHAAIESPACRAMAQRALAAVELLERADDPLSHLSGGERARVHFARALCQIGFGETGRCLLLDEPTAALDPAHAFSLFATVRNLCDAGVQVVAVLHDLNLAAQVADHMLLLHQGSVRAAGSPSEVLTEELLSQVFDVEASVDERPAAPGVPRVTLLGRRGRR